MKEFQYEITDALGIHARPAGQLAKLAKSYESKVVIKAKGKSVEATKLMMLMGLGITNGENVSVIIEGTDEEKAFEDIQTFFKENL